MICLEMRLLLASVDDLDLVGLVSAGHVPRVGGKVCSLVLTGPNLALSIFLIQPIEGVSLLKLE